jgi:DNA modification methylase
MNHSSSEIADFLEKHVHPYDPATDDYERGPLIEDVYSEGRSDFYNLHYYPTKVPPEIIAGFIEHYTKPEDVVLDPFCGSGMTGVAAQMLGDRNVVLNDLSVAACHIARNYTNTVRPLDLNEEYERIRPQLRAEGSRLYTTVHYQPTTDEYSLEEPEVRQRIASNEWRLAGPEEQSSQHLAIPASIKYTIWSDVYECNGMVTITEPTGRISKRGNNVGKPTVRKLKVGRGCGKDICLYDVAVDKESGEVSEDFECPHCGQKWQKLALSFKATIPVVIVYQWIDIRGKKRNGSRRATSVDCKLIDDAGKEPVQYWMPDEKIWAGRELMTMGPNRKGIQKISDFFTPRNFRALGFIWNTINTQTTKAKEALKFAFTSQVNRASRLRRMRPLGPGEQLSGTLYVASLTVESNVFKIFELAVSNYRETVGQVKPRKAACVVNNGSATCLPIPDSSIDYIFTDPPFGGNLYYADVALLWEAWLGRFTDETQELVYNRQRAKDKNFRTIETYARGMKEAFSEMFRVLKPGRWCTVEFNNSDGRVFQAICDAASNAGFRIENMLLFDKKLKTFKQFKASIGDEEVVDKDVLFNLHRPTTKLSLGESDESDIEGQVAQAVRTHLQTLPGKIKTYPEQYNEEHRTTATINTMLMNTLIPRGVSVERLNLPFIERVCSRYFRKIGLRWYLRGEVIGSADWLGQPITVEDEFSAVAWLRQQIAGGPKLIGELKPLWMRATGMLATSVATGLNLERLLVENFWREASTNRWREPSEEERGKMNDDRSLRVLHDAERLVSGTLERSVGNAEVCQWIKVLFEACKELEDGVEGAIAAHLGFDRIDGYRLIVQLSNRLTPDGLEPKILTDARKQAAVAGRRLAETPAATPVPGLRQAKAKKDEGPTLFDLPN